jgi:iron complex outermembrane receptor protein
MDRAFKSDAKWFSDYTNAYNVASAGGQNDAASHISARTFADNGRYMPGTAVFDQKKAELVNINNWDYGAALRVKSALSHTEGIINWDKVFKKSFSNLGIQLLSGFDHRTYIIIPDGNYFINPQDSNANLLYSKSGGFTQVNKRFFQDKLRISATVRVDKADYFKWKINPRFTLVYAPKDLLSIRVAYQSGYRFPSIFEGFSNVNSGGVKRIGGLEIMSQGVFENSYTKSSIDAFQEKVISDVNTLGITQSQAIENNKGWLKKNPYTYIQPEYVKSLELGVRSLALKKHLFIDADFYYNSYDNFIAQVEASVPNTTILDSIPTYLFSKSTQSRYRMWTNSKSKIYNYGASLGLRYRYNEHFSIQANISYSKLDRTEEKDGLEDGFNTPAVITNVTLIGEKLWNNFGASLTGRLQNAFSYMSFLVNGEVPAYWTMDAQINYTLTRSSILLKIGATNLLNKAYYSILGGSSIGGMYYLSVTYGLKD